MNLARENLLQDLGRLVIWYPFRWLTRLLPLQANLAIFEAFGDLAYHLYPQKRALITRRLAEVFPQMGPEARVAEVRASFRNYFVDRFIINLLPGLDRTRIDRLAILEGEEHLRQALARGRGAVLVHPHFGPSQLPLIYLGYKGYPMAQMGLRMPMETSDIGRATQRLRVEIEEQMPVSHFYADNYLRPVLRWLEQGRILMTAGDGTGGQRYIGKYRRAMLLGHALDMPLGPYRLAALHQSPILPIIALRRSRGFYRIVIHPPLEADRGLESTQQQFITWFTPYLALAPGQWHFWDEWDLDQARVVAPPIPLRAKERSRNHQFPRYYLPERKSPAIAYEGCPGSNPKA
jgi:lauroyl/myristoyl acyltransferase